MERICEAELLLLISERRSFSFPVSDSSGEPRRPFEESDARLELGLPEGERKRDSLELPKLNRDLLGEGFGEGL